MGKDQFPRGGDPFPFRNEGEGCRRQGDTGKVHFFFDPQRCHRRQGFDNGMARPPCQLQTGGRTAEGAHRHPARCQDQFGTAAAAVFRFPPLRRLRRVWIPSVMPHFLSACRTSLGLAWKSGIAAEVLTVPALSIGKLLMESKLYWEVLDLFAWTLVVILCSLVIEKVLMTAIGRLGRSFQAGGEAQ